MTTGSSKRNVMLKALAVCCVVGLCASGLLLGLVEGSPKISGIDMWHEKATDTYHIEGRVSIPVGGEVDVLGWRWPVATRTVPFTLTKPGKSIGSEWIEQEAFKIAEGTKGTWELNIAAFIAEWLILSGVLWVVWLSVHSVRRTAVQRPDGSDSGEAGGADERGDE